MVIDEQGNEYEATYPKRAKGLVKNGRARFVSDNTICLACPPDIYLEDKNMEKNIDKVETPVAEQIESSHYNVDYILEQLSFMAKQTALITDAFEKVSDMPDSGDVNSVAIQAKAQAVTETVKARETTNQQLIRLYEKMYDNIIGQGSASSKVNLFVPLLELIDDDELKANLIATKIVDAVLS